MSHTINQKGSPNRITGKGLKFIRCNIKIASNAHSSYSIVSKHLNPEMKPLRYQYKRNRKQHTWKSMMSKPCHKISVVSKAPAQKKTRNKANIAPMFNLSATELVRRITDHTEV